jgi:excinuclease UvrABC nuclease subunit
VRRHGEAESRVTGRKLRALGFAPAGEFLAAEKSGGRIRYDGRELLPTTSGLYAFVLNDRVMYIGVAGTNLRRRVAGGHGRALTERKPSYAAEQLRGALQAGERVRVMIATPEPGSWNGIPVDTALGLEPALIEQAQPPWNVMGSEGEEAIAIWREAARKAHATRQKLRAAERSGNTRKVA